MLFREHPAEGIHRRHSRARAGFRIESPRPAPFGVFEPVGGGHPLVGAGHFHPGFPGQIGWLGGRRRQVGIGPPEFLQDSHVHRLHLQRRWVIAPVQPHQHAGMIPEAQDLRPLRFGRDLVVLFFPVLPLLPVMAAAPPRHDQNAVPVSQIEEAVGLHLPFHSDGVQVHIPDVPDFRFFSFGRGPQQHIGGPPAPAYEDLSSVDGEVPLPLLVPLRSDFSNAEADDLAVGDFAR